MEARKRILVVEDDETIRKLLVEYLKQHAFINVDGARDGIEALHQLALHHYSVIVLDVWMPKMSGVDFLDSLKALAEDPSLKTLDRLPGVIVITATPPAELPAQTIEQRFPNLVRAVFRKPLDVMLLAQTVDEALRR
ncbi:MAG TPA: response regulator [Thermoanaerobaculia bacterium]|jgi:CheY-like chemotaxis protein|nr:response regulator [Thermoanaerobaculia bacterium]